MTPFRLPLAARLLAPLLGLLGATCAPPKPSPNLVLVLVDQLRQDSVAGWMPRVSALAEEGVVFDQMRAAAPWTYPSVVSMFSGLYPQQHGADGYPGVTPGEPALLTTFDDRVPSFARILKDRYHTAAFVTNPFLQTWNPLHRGFDHYEVDAFIGDQGPTRGHAGAVWTDHMFGDSVNAKVLEHYRARPYTGAEPELTYVHYIDVHGPWDGAPFDLGEGEGAAVGDTAEAARRAAAAFLDERIEELYAFFSERYDGDLYFVVTSDHGMELGDEITWEPVDVRQRKATVHDFNTRVPFLVLPSKHVPASRRVSTPCSNVDVCPTVLDWTGEPYPPNLPGKSLAGAVRGEPLEERPVYSLMTAFGRHNDCLVVHGKKLFRHFDPTDPEGAPPFKLVYDLVQDPGERAPISDSFGPDGALLLEAARTGPYHFEKRYEEPDPDLVRRLQDLGY